MEERNWLVSKLNVYQISGSSVEFQRTLDFFWGEKNKLPLGFSTKYLASKDGGCEILISFSGVVMEKQE